MNLATETFSKKPSKAPSKTLSEESLEISSKISLETPLEAYTKISLKNSSKPNTKNKDPLFLLTSLQEFGLNPEDWVVENIQSYTIELSHLEDDSLRIKGCYRNKKWLWLEMLPFF
jgi:hypothetical protein